MITANYYLKTFSFAFLIFSIPFVHGSTIDYSYRLPRNIVPTNYNLTVKLNYKAHDGAQHGIVNIEALVQIPTKEIILHSYAENIIDDIIVESSNNTSLKITGQKLEARTETLRIHLDEELENGQAIRITIVYRWIMQSTSTSETPRGGFKTDEYDLLTQFQPAGARRVFPSFDEPNFKATFDITVILKGYPKNRVVLSNMPLKKEKTNHDSSSQTFKFKQTPIMSTYLVAIAIPLNHDDTVTLTENSLGTVAIHNVQKIAAKKTGKLVAKSLKAMKKLTGIEYHVEKIDYAGRLKSYYAMENWGLVIGAYKPTFFPIHETIHGWFGNMVTCAWWDDIWLNEGFTSYYEVLIAHKIGEYDHSRKVAEFSKLRQMTLTKYGHRALHDKAFDARYINSPWAAVYFKGPTIIKMFHKALGDRFEPRLFEYLRRNLYKNVNSSNLISALTHDNELDERKMLTSFIFNKDVPLIEIVFEPSSRKFEISQIPFEFKHENLKWTVPIWFRRSKYSKEEFLWARENKEVHKVHLNENDDPTDFIFDEDCKAFAVFKIIIGPKVQYFCGPDNQDSSSQQYDSYSTENNDF